MMVLSCVLQGRCDLFDGFNDDHDLRKQPIGAGIGCMLHKVPYTRAHCRGTEESSQVIAECCRCTICQMIGGAVCCCVRAQWNKSVRIRREKAHSRPFGSLQILFRGK